MGLPFGVKYFVLGVSLLDGPDVLYAPTADGGMDDWQGVGELAEEGDITVGSIDEPWRGFGVIDDEVEE